MSKTVTSPVDKFPGTVTLWDPIPLPRVLAYEASIAKIRALEASSNSTISEACIPGILQCIEEINIEGFPENVTFENWPFTPRWAAAKLVAWIMKEIDIIVDGEQVPEV